MNRAQPRRLDHTYEFDRAGDALRVVLPNGEAFVVLVDENGTLEVRGAGADKALTMTIVAKNAIRVKAEQ